MKAIHFIPLFLFVLAACSVHPGKNDLVTDRIQYDVNIKNKEADADWWQQNIEGRKREVLIADILNAAKSGKLQLYDYFSNKLLTSQEIALIFKKTDTVSVDNPNPPYQSKDTVLVRELRPGDITRIRFLEEWTMNRKTLEFQKQVKGICPMLENYSETGELRGYQPLFWVFFDKNYPGLLSGK